MTKPTIKTWPELAYEGWLLGAEMNMVIWQRSVRMMLGGKRAEREAMRMVSEKVTTAMTLMPALMAGGLSQSPEETATRTLAHYSRPVRANRKRLSR